MRPEKHPSSLSQIITAVVIALLVGTASPWWWKLVFPDRGETTIGTSSGDNRMADATKSYWDSSMKLTQKYIGAFINHRDEFYSEIRKPSGSSIIAVDELKQAYYAAITYVTEVEKLNPVFVDPVLTSATAESLLLVRELAESYRRLYENIARTPGHYSPNSQENGQRVEELFEKITNLEERNNHNATSFRRLRLRLADKYKIDFPLP